MKKYVLKRLLLLFPTLLGITFVVFMVSHLAPGGPLEAELSKLKALTSEGGASQKQISKEATFIAVGAGHLGGTNGVLELLKKQGYTVSGINN